MQRSKACAHNMSSTKQLMIELSGYKYTTQIKTLKQVECQKGYFLNYCLHKAREKYIMNFLGDLDQI